MYMKKINLSLLFVMLFMASVICIKAATAKAPSVVPSEGDVLYADTDEEFDFSAISFSSVPDGARITGKKSMKKIMLAPGIDVNGKINDEWFTAYCLDGMLKYPLAFYKGLPGTLDEQSVRNAAFLKYVIDNPTSFDEMVGYMYFNADGSDISQEVIDDFNAGKTVTVGFSSVEICKGLNDCTGKGWDSTPAAGGTNPEKPCDDEICVTFSKSDIMIDRYTTINMPDSLYYNRALWIIEHSYPTLSIESSLKEAGADYDKLFSEIKALHIGYNDEQVAEALENYVYSTVQYAIWRSEDGYKETIDNKEYALGDTLYGSNELNKLYKYLIKDRDVYENYDSVTYDNKLEIVKPSEGKEIFRENEDSYVFGPYSIKTSMISIGNANVNIGNKSKDGLSIIDKAGNKISSIKTEEEFYVRVMKKASVGSVSVNVSTANGLKFESVSNRGRLYSPSNFTEQTVASGGKIVKAEGNVSFDIIVNAKTGVQDVIKIIFIGFAAFAIGYLVLRYKGESLELN